MMKEKEYFKNKKICILGFSRTGKALLKFLLKLKTNIFISELNNIDLTEVDNMPNVSYETGVNSEKILKSDLIIVSPGVDSELDMLEKARKKKIEVLSELEFAYNFIDPKRIIGITGTNGKTTTTVLVYEICKAYGESTILAGNIGVPLISKIDEINNETTVVLEISSFQLENINKLRINNAAILNISEDHLDRYKDLDEYASIKAGIFKNQKEDDIALYNKNDIYSKFFERKIKSKKICFDSLSTSADIYLNNGKIIFKELDFIFDTNKLKIKGMHNIENVMAAIALTKHLILKDKNILNKALSDFAGVEHRLESVKTKSSIKFINDSKATNVDSVLVALKSFTDNIVLLIGGRDKGASYEPLKEEISKKVKCVIAFGEARDIIYKELNTYIKVIKQKSLKDAFLYATSVTNINDTVLLSPGCSSFDEFKNYEERGTYFKKLVTEFKDSCYEK